MTVPSDVVTAVAALSLLALQNSPVQRVPRQSHIGPLLPTTHTPAPQSTLTHAATSSSSATLDTVFMMPTSADDGVPLLFPPPPTAALEDNSDSDWFIIADTTDGEGTASDVSLPT